MALVLRPLINHYLSTKLFFPSSNQMNKPQRICVPIVEEYPIKIYKVDANIPRLMFSMQRRCFTVCTLGTIKMIYRSQLDK